MRPQSLYLSRVKKQNGHWVCWTSTGSNKTTVQCEEHTRTHAPLFPLFPLLHTHLSAPPAPLILMHLPFKYEALSRGVRESSEYWQRWQLPQPVQRYCQCSRGTASAYWTRLQTKIMSYQLHKRVCRQRLEGSGCRRRKRGKCPLPLEAVLGSYWQVLRTSPTLWEND